MTARRQYAVLGPLPSLAETRGFLGCEMVDGTPQRDTPVVVLWIPASITNDEKQIARLQRETAFVTQLRHPNVVRVYGLESFEEGWARVVGFGDGEPLACALDLARSGETAVPAKIAARIIADAADAVHYAHDEGLRSVAGRPLVHGGLRPDTMVLGFDGVTRVSGFGASALLEATKSADQACFLAPEQVIGGKATASPATDIYALGAVLYTMLGGRPPFEDDDDIEGAIMAEPPAALELEGLGGRLATVASQAMQKRGGKRFGNVAAMSASILSELADDGMATHEEVAAWVVEMIPPETPERTQRADLLQSASDPDVVTMLHHRDPPEGTDQALFEASRPMPSSVPKSRDSAAAAASADASQLAADLADGADAGATTGEVDAPAADEAASTEADSTDEAAEAGATDEAAELESTDEAAGVESTDEAAEAGTTDEPAAPGSTDAAASADAGDSDQLAQATGSTEEVAPSDVAAAATDTAAAEAPAEDDAEVPARREEPTVADPKLSKPLADIQVPVREAMPREAETVIADGPPPSGAPRTPPDRDATVPHGGQSLVELGPSVAAETTSRIPGRRRATSGFTMDEAMAVEGTPSAIPRSPIREDSITTFRKNVGDSSRVVLFLALGSVLALLVAVFYFSKAPEELSQEAERHNLPKEAVRIALQSSGVSELPSNEPDGQPPLVPPPAMDGEPTAEGELEIEDAPKLKTGSLKLTTQPEVDVYVGKKHLGRTPLSAKLRIGKQKIRFTDKDKRLNIYKTYRILPGGKHTDFLEFQKSELTVVAPDGANIMLNGKTVGEAPMPPIEIYQGQYHLKVLVGNETWAKWFEAPPGRKIKYTVTMK